MERIFGTSEYIFQVDQSLKMICDYESKYGSIVISRRKLNTFSNNFLKMNVHNLNSSNQLETMYFDPNHPDTCSSTYADIFYRKGHFIMIMLQKRLGKDQFLKVIYILYIAFEMDVYFLKTKTKTKTKN